MLSVAFTTACYLLPNFLLTIDLINSFKTESTVMTDHSLVCHTITSTSYGKKHPAGGTGESGPSASTGQHSGVESGGLGAGKPALSVRELES